MWLRQMIAATTVDSNARSSGPPLPLLLLLCVMMIVIAIILPRARLALIWIFVIVIAMRRPESVIEIEIATNKIAFESEIGIGTGIGIENGLESEIETMIDTMIAPLATMFAAMISETTIVVATSHRLHNSSSSLRIRAPPLPLLLTPLPPPLLLLVPHPSCARLTPTGLRPPACSTARLHQPRAPQRRHSRNVRTPKRCERRSRRRRHSALRWPSRNGRGKKRRKKNCCAQQQNRPR